MRTAVLVSAVIMAMIADGAAQPPRFRGGRNRFAMSVATELKYDGGFNFCRIMFRTAPYGDGGNWQVDYPRADVNLSFRLSELTSTTVSRGGPNEFNHVALRLTDPQIAKCPIIMMTEVGNTYLDEDEARHLREYLLRGGFLWVDDFWGDYAWQVWENEIRKVLPSSAYPIVDLSLDHPLFHTLYDVRHFPQIPSISFYFGSGGRTSERGHDSAVPHARAIFDATGHMIVFITHNTDFGDAFEREGEHREYFDRFAADGYAVGINVILYAMTH
jgi:Domain of unknown function (DUF4159)